ncbi:MAG: hypothetical protein JXA13_10595 [Anaerolineales bacterium]|nr:hypothetical protein [Anaerolineales bacterium]
MGAKKVEDAINAIKAGNEARGRALLVDALRDDPKDESAWLLLAKVVSDKKQREDCLTQVLKINPENEIARLGLAKLDNRHEKTSVPVSKPKQNRNWLFAAGGSVLLLGALIASGLFWLIREKNTEVVAVDMSSVFTWKMIDEAALVEVGNQVRTSLEEEKRKLLAVNPDIYNEYLFWNNAEIMRYTGYLWVRLPVNPDDAGIIEVQELILFYEFYGPTDIETPTMKTVNVTVYVKVLDQDTGRLKIKRYEEDSSPFIFDCFVCPTYAFDQCFVLQGCNWINLR